MTRHCHFIGGLLVVCALWRSCGVAKYKGVNLQKVVAYRNLKKLWLIGI